MKVYIITSGEYSDYGIDKVFLDKAKAEEYVRLNSRKYDEPTIEEYETSDETFEIGRYEIKKYLSIQYQDKNYYGNEEFSIQLMQDNTGSCPDLNDYPYYYNSYSFYTYSYPYHNINLHRLVNDDFTDENIEDIKDKYLKVCRDDIAKAKSLIADGYSEKQIKEMLFG